MLLASGAALPKNTGFYAQESWADSVQLKHLFEPSEADSCLVFKK